MAPIWAATAAAALTALGALIPEPGEPTAGASGSAATDPAALGPNADPRRAACPGGTLPDHGVCIPAPTRALTSLAPLEAERGQHRDRSGSWVSYEQIPRRPERPADYAAYRYPVPLAKGGGSVVSGYDLHLADSEQRRGAHLGAVGHGGIDVTQRRGTEVRLLRLEHQIADADVIYVGELFGLSVVTRHALREGGQLREYLMIHGHLEGPAPGLTQGSSLSDGALLGFVGDSGSPGVVHLHLEVRRVREGVKLSTLSGGQLAHASNTVVCDPRNVLPLAADAQSP